MASDIPSAALNARAFQDACAYGDLEAAQSLAHDMTTDDARAFGNYALRHACINGHLATARPVRPDSRRHPRVRQRGSTLRLRERPPEDSSMDSRQVRSDSRRRARI